MSDPSLSAHSVSVERRGPQRFVAVCSCGWEGMNRVGTEFYGKGPALSAVFKHQEEHGLTVEIPAYVDLDPGSRRDTSRAVRREARRARRAASDQQRLHEEGQ